MLIKSRAQFHTLSLLHLDIHNLMKYHTKKFNTKEDSFMDITKAIAELKKEEGFKENVGMMLIHNGVVRGTSRKDKSTVTSVKVTPDNDKIQAICKEMEQNEGIFRILAHANSGELFPGDDLLYLVVAGDIRENVKDTFAKLLDRVKSEAVVKQEYTI